MCGEKESDLVGKRDVENLGLFLQDGGSCFDIGGLNVTEEPPLKTGAETFIEVWNRVIAVLNDDIKVLHGITGKALLFEDEQTVIKVSDNPNWRIVDGICSHLGVKTVSDEAADRTNEIAAYYLRITTLMDLCQDKRVNLDPFVGYDEDEWPLYVHDALLMAAAITPIQCRIQEKGVWSRFVKKTLITRTLDFAANNCNLPDVKKRKKPKKSKPKK